MEPGGAIDELLNEAAPMRPEAVPNENDGSADLILEMAEELADEIAGDIGVGMEPELEANATVLRGEAQGSDDGDLAVACGALPEDGSAAAGRPGPANEGGHQKAALVYKDDRGVQVRGFFLIRGHSSLIHRLISCSSRSIARRSGLWGDQPSKARSRQT